MNKTSKKILIPALAVVIVAAGALLYFRPLALSALLDDGQQLLITRTELDSKNGAAVNSSQDYNDLTPEQTNAILDLLGQYSYRRTLGTGHSDGSLTGSYSQLFLISICENNAIVDTIIFTDAGNISIHGKTYQLKDSPDLSRKLSEIIGQNR